MLLRFRSNKVPAMRASQNTGRATCIILLLLMCYHYTVDAFDCSTLNGCMACTEQPQASTAKLPPGYKINPDQLAPRPLTAAMHPSSSSTSSYTVAGPATAGLTSTPPANENKLALALAALKAAGSALFGKRRRLLQGLGGGSAFPVSSAFVGYATPAEAAITGVSSSAAGALPQQVLQQQQQQVIPQIPVPATLATGNVVSGASGFTASAADVNGQRMVHAASMPLIMAPPASIASGGGMPTTVPMVFPVAPQQQGMGILVTDPRNHTGPHPWDVLLFKTNQFNTSKPAYRLGGLGLMLMSDFNKTQPLTDWHILRRDEPKQRASDFQSWNFVRDFGGSNSAAFDVNQSGIPSGGGSSGIGEGNRLSAPLNSNEGPLFGFGGLMSKKPPGLGDATAQFTPRFSSFFKPPASVSTESAVGTAAVGAGNGTSKQLWCTVCQTPAYQLSPYGYCGE